MSDSLPIHSSEAEAGALGCILSAPENGGKLLSKLNKSDFYDLRHREIFTALHCLTAEGKDLDVPTTYQWLKDKGRLQDAGDIGYLATLPDATPSASSFESFLFTLKDKANRRELIRLAMEARQMAENESLDPKAMVHEFTQLSARVAARSSEPREWFHFLKPSECRLWTPPEGLVLVGDYHLVRGSVSVIGGAPGVGKSRALHSLAIAGATGPGADWLGLKVHRRFKTAILQNENGLYRLKSDFADIGADGLDGFIRISDIPPLGMAFGHVEFRAALAEWLAEFKPDLFAFDPWNSAAQDDKQRDYLETLRAIRDVLPKGEDAPHWVIAAHTRKPKSDEKKSGRGLLNLLAGSYVLGSVPRSVFVLQAATDEPEDDRVVWTCCKNNDGELGKRSAWHRRNGLFVPCHDFDWKAFDGPEDGGRQTVTQAHMERLFEGGRRLERKHAARELEEITGLKHTACYNALSLTGRFSANLKEDSEGLLCWQAYPGEA